MEPLRTAHPDPGVHEEDFVELHSKACQCGGMAAEGLWDSTRRPCSNRSRHAIGIVVDRARWEALGSPRSEEAFREALAVGPEARQG